MASAQPRYSLWNQRLLETFFNASMSGTDVWLSLDPDELDSIGADLGGDQGLLVALRQGPEWPTTQRSTGDPRWLGEVVEKLIQQRVGGRSRPPTYTCPSSLNSAYRETSPPTYLPIIAALIRSAAMKEADGYYAHLQHALGLPTNWGPAQMQDVLRAFDDLQSWTQACVSRFGRFTVRRLGGYSLIGVPGSQCVIPKHDSLLIGRVFARARLKPEEHLGGKELKDVFDLIGQSHFLTRALRRAASHPGGEFDEPLRARLQALLDEWDGSVPIASNTADDHSKAIRAQRTDEGEIRLCLIPKASPDLHWDIAWRVPRIVDEGVVTISRGQGRWHARIYGGDTGATTDQTDAVQAVAAAAALQTAVGLDGQIEFLASLSETIDEGDRVIGALRLKKTVLRILVPALNAVARRTELWELPLPINGPAYLLASPDCWDSVQKYLERNAIPHQIFPSAGLPSGWCLACITSCEFLNQTQRDEIPDGQDERPAPRPIRLAGGRPVQQGGIRKYPAYDLPMIELDAPTGTLLDTKGLRLEEISGGPPDDAGTSAHRLEVTMRRFRIIVSDDERGTFDIRAKDLAGTIIGSATLRILADSVGQSSTVGGATFGLDSLGKPATAFPNLSGIVYASKGAPTEGGPQQGAAWKIEQIDLGRYVASSDALAMSRHPVAGFLDSLALCGSMLYGTARDQIARLSLACGTPIENPTFVLLDLRARGHVEIETNHMGRIVRIHAVAPTAYQMPVATDDCIVLGLLGTFRLACWESLADRSMPWYAVEASGNKFNLPAWRLLALEGDTALKDKLSDCGLHYHATSPATAVLDWSCSIDEVRAEARSWGNEKLIGADTLAERFNPASRPLFIPANPPHFNHEGAEVQLLRCEDWQTRAHRVYSIGVRDEQRIVRFSFMRDSRWGVWLAIVALGQFLQRVVGIPDGVPWPLPYLRASGTLLIPAPTGLPSMLERALVLCSGEPAQVISMDGKQSQTESRLDLHRASDGALVGTISVAYTELATGRWLAYRWIPRVVAELLARKVGGKLDET